MPYTFDVRSGYTPVTIENAGDARSALLAAVAAGRSLHGIVIPHWTNLAGANLVGANLAYADLAGANLAGANLEGADLARANLTDANLEGAARTADDARIPGWVLTADGLLTRGCLACDEPAAECGYCEACCDHHDCSCGEHTSNWCDTCDTCHSCCSCRECYECGGRIGCDDEQEEIEGHTYCGSCADSVCPKNAGSPWRDGKKRLAGVEWEYNDPGKSPLANWAREWHGGIHSDGSCGWEAVTPPIAGKHVRSCLSALGRALAQSRTEIDEDCGLHVHVDAADLRWADMFRLLKVYAHVEPLLYLLAGQHRVKNQYCAPCGEKYREALVSRDRKGSVLAVAHNGELNQILAIDAAKRVQRRPVKKSDGRYKGLNIAPWLAGKTQRREERASFYDYRGAYRSKCKFRHHATKSDTTVEFRLHRNTSDAERVIGWTELCVSIVDWVASHNDTDADNLPKSPLRALIEIAPDSRTWIIARVAAWRKATPARTDGVPRDGARMPPRRVRFAGGTAYLVGRGVSTHAETEGVL